MLSFLFKNSKCKHKKVSPVSTGNYCPDCGKEIEIIWHLLRCKNCSSKRKSAVIFNKIQPVESFCMKCGYTDFFIEQKERLDFFDYEFATITKREMKRNICFKEKVQIWIEKEDVPEQYSPNKSLICHITG